MCLICDCQSFDCWPDKTWCIFFGIWNAIIGFILSAWTGFELTNVDATLFAEHLDHNTLIVIYSISLVFYIVGFLAGVFILLGVFLESKPLFTVGKFMSHIMPWFEVITIILPVVHLICLYRVCRYHKNM